MINMAAVIFIVCILLNLFLVFIGKRSKIFVIVTIALFGLIMAFSSTEVGGGDSYYYNLEYNDSNLLINKGEIVFNFLMIFFPKIGVSFQWFRFLLFLIGSFLIGYSCKKFKVNIHLFLVLYAISIYYFLCVSLNFFLALSVVTFALYFLYRKKPIYYVVLIIFASFIHQSMLFSLVFLILLFKKNAYKKYYRVMSILMLLEFIITIIMTIFTSSIAEFTNIIYSITKPFFNDNSAYLQRYLTVGYSRQCILYALFYVIGLIWARFGRNYIMSSDIFSEDQKEFANFSLIIATMCSIFIPFLIVTPTMMRMLFLGLINMFFIFGICASHHCTNINMSFTVNNDKTLIGTNISKRLFLILSIFVAGLWLTIYFRHELSFDFVDFFGGNSLF